MRLKPIEKPASLKLRLVYSLMRRQLGKTPTPIKVLSARMPSSVKVTTTMYKVEKKLSLDEELKFLVEYFTSFLNGCTFCMDIGKAYLVRSKHKLDKFNSITEYATNDMFSGQERAALAYVEEITKNRHVQDETFNRLLDFYSEQQIIEITYLVAVQTFTNLSNIALGIESDGLCEIALHTNGAMKKDKNGIDA